MKPLENNLLQSATKQGWKKIGIKQHHGITLLLSSLHSQQSCGIGEFFDLLPLMDWCQKLTMDVIQLLPLNQLEGDPSPYNAFSSCALNFLHLSLHALPFLEKEEELKNQLKQLQLLNQTDRLALADVTIEKTKWLHQYVEAAGNKIAKTDGFREYIEDNPWLKPYALYRTLIDELGSPDKVSWPEEFSSFNAKTFEQLTEKHKDAMHFYLLMQYLCFLQLKAVKEYGKERGIFLMGDLPILLSAHSVDIWKSPHLFIKDLHAGAPPDVYNEEGQNWKFPIFNWDAERKEQFHYWKTRLHYAEQFYDIIRIDHVLGFFRIWAIPPGRSSKEGYFIPIDQTQWMPQGQEILDMIASSTQMLPIAEDLGAVQEMVRPCLKQMGICGTKILRWERDWETAKKEFIPIYEYNPISVTSVSTHDAEPLTLWWNTYPEDAKAYAEYKKWTYTPNLNLDQKEAILWDSHHSSSLFHINLLYEYLSLYPELVHSNPEDERINLPGTTLETNWTYKCVPSVEEIISHQNLFEKIKKIIN